VGQLFGGALLTLGVILWLARDFRDEAAVRGMLIGAIIGNVINLVVAIVGTFVRHVECFGVVHRVDLPLWRRGKWILPDSANITAIASLKLSSQPAVGSASRTSRTPKMVGVE
jgi:hypothetical protein